MKNKKVFVLIMIPLIALVCTFVWLSIKINVSNETAFNFEEVSCTITGDIEGAKAGTYKTYGPRTIVANDVNAVLNPWSTNLEFYNTEEPITISLIIVNNSTEFTVSVGIEDNKYTTFDYSNSNVERTAKYSVSNFERISNANLTSNIFCIEPTKTAEVIFTLKIIDSSKGVKSFVNDLNITLDEYVYEYKFMDGQNQIATFSSRKKLLNSEIPQLTNDEQPAFYGLYKDVELTNKVHFPYSSSQTTLYAKIENPTNLTFSLMPEFNSYEVASSGLISGNIEIPEKYNWLPVSKIKENGFSGLQISSITIPSSLNTFTNNCFNNCPNFTTFAVDCDNTVFTALDGVLLSKSQEQLYAYPSGRQASYSIPHGVRTLCPYSFCGTTGLTSVTIPSTIRNINIKTFDSCPALTEIIVDENSMYFKSVENVVFSKDGTDLILCANSKNGIYTVPFGVELIESYAFSNCKLLTRINLASTITTIGDFAFVSCDNLAYIDSNLSATFKTINGVLFNFESTKIVCYPKGISSTAYTIPEEVVEIGDCAFYECSLTSLILQDNVTTISYKAFKNSNITSLTLNSNLTSISYYAFDNAVISEVIIDSNTISSSITSINSAGKLLSGFSTGDFLFIKNGLTIGSYISSTENFSDEGTVDVNGTIYRKFVKI
ncbi:MAG: leucine-rich repeat domain-containing protein [Clostridia bacterium]